MVSFPCFLQNGRESPCGARAHSTDQESQQHPYHPAVVPEEDEARFGDHPWPVGARDGQVLSLRLQACSAQCRVEKRQLLLGTGNQKVEMRGGPCGLPGSAERAGDDRL